MLTAALGWAMPSTAALFTAEDGSIALVLEQDAYPLEVRLTQDRAARLDHHFTAASPHAAPTQVAGGLAFLARKSQASGAPSGEVFFCVADTQGRDCRPGPFSANSPLVRDSVPGQVVGWHGPPGERTVISFDPSTRRTVPLSTPLPAVDLAMAS